MSYKEKGKLIANLKGELERLKNEATGISFDRAFLFLNMLEEEKDNNPLQESGTEESFDNIMDINKWLKTILDTMPGAVFWKDSNFKFKYGNKVFLDVIGYNSLADIKGKTDYDLSWSKEQCDHFRSDDLDLLKSKKPKIGIVEMLTKPDGTTIWLETNKALLVNEKGDIEGIIGFIQDITESRSTKQALKHSEARLKSYFNNATDGIIVLNHDFQICEVNMATEKIIGLQSSELLKKRLFDLFCEEEKENDFEEACRSINVEPISKEASILTPEGNLKFVNLDVINIEIGHCICFLKDISELKMAVKEAEESNRLKTAFLQNISHEIRTPLNAIIGFSNILMKGLYESDEDANQYKKIIHSNSGYLLNLINSVIDLSKIESGQTNLTPQKTPIISFVNDEVLPLIESERIRLNRNDVRVLFQTDDAMQDFIMYIDNNRLKQILVNLMQNSLKFTEKGYVKVGIKQKSDAICFTISDTGCGIPNDQINRIFHRFYKVQDSSKNCQGSGLGLAIVKKLLTLMNGVIKVDSDTGKGTVFTVDLPIGL